MLHIISKEELELQDFEKTELYKQYKYTFIKRAVFSKDSENYKIAYIFLIGHQYFQKQKNAKIKHGSSLIGIVRRK